MNPPTQARIILAVVAVFSVLVFCIMYRWYEPRAHRSPALHRFTRPLVILVVIVFWLAAFAVYRLSTPPHLW
jgi:hypothetical protein